MQILNAARSSEYFDSLSDERDDGAVTAIHGAWLEHSSSLRRAEFLEPDSPLDMLILYQAAAAAFRDWSPVDLAREPLTAGGRIINRDKAVQKLRAIQGTQLAALASCFANRVIALSETASEDQDLLYFVELFVRSIQSEEVIANILSGAISRHSKLLSDPDFW